MIPLLLLACLAEAPLLPELDLPADVWLQREWIPLGPGERSLGRVERFDLDGCWTHAPNTLLWVHDPVLLAAPSPGLYFNGRFDAAPWFCLDASQRWRLERVLDELPDQPVLDLDGDAVLAVRWSARVDGRVRSATHAYGRRSAATAPLEDLLGSLVGEGIWAQSPDEPPPSTRTTFFSP